MQRPFLSGVVPFLVGLTTLAVPASPQEPGSSSVEALQRELESLRRDYADRIAALEARLEALRQAQENPPASPVPAPPEAPPPTLES